MSSITPDAVRNEIEARALRAGNDVKTSTYGVATASSLLYVDSSSQLAVGDLPFPLKVSGLSATTTTFLDFTGATTLSASNDLGSQIVVGSAVTTFSTTAFIKVTLTDEGGNITDGDHYIMVGTLS